MSTTPQDILDEAVPRSGKNRPALVDAAPPEYLALVNRVVKTFFSVAARVNPEFFGDDASLPWVPASGGWARPSLAEAVFYLERTGDEEVVVVPYGERNVDPGQPRVYRLGGYYRQAGADALPAESETLTALFSRQAPLCATIDTAIDASWPENFNGLLVEEVAIYLALKDGRVDEVGQLRASRDSWLRLYLAHLEHETLGVVRKFSPDYMVTGTIVPLNSLLAGGTEVEV
jgi:hypothetical protein